MSKRPVMAGLTLLAIIAGGLLLSSLLTPPPGGESLDPGVPDGSGDSKSGVAPVSSGTVPGIPTPAEPRAPGPATPEGRPSGKSSAVSTKAPQLRLKVTFDPPTSGLALPALALLRDGEAHFGKPDGDELVWEKNRLELDKGGKFQLRMGFELARRSIETAKERRSVIGVKPDAEHPWFAWPAKAPILDLESHPEGPGEVVLRLRHTPRRVEVRVTDETGRALAGASVTSQPEPYAPFFRAPGNDRFAQETTNAEGSATVVLMPSKRVRIRARAGSGGFASERYDWPPPLVVPLVIQARVPAAENPELLHLRVRAIGPDKARVSGFHARARLVEAIPPGDQEQRYTRKAVSSFRRNDAEPIVSLHWRGQTGRWRVEATTKDLSGAVEIRLDRRGVPVDVEVPLAARPRLTGVVLKPDGAPAPGAVLSLGPFGPWGFAPTNADRHSKTDSEGRFSLPVDGDDKWLRVFLDGYRQVSIAVQPASAPLEIRLAPGGDVFGRVIDAQGSPAAARRVKLSIGEGRMFARTDNDGRFRFRGVPEETLSLGVSSGPGTPSARFTTVLHDADQTFRLPPGETLELVTTRGGEPVTTRASARIVSLSLDATPGGVAYATVLNTVQLRAGRAKVDNLPPGDYLIELTTQPNQLERSAGALIRRRLPGPDSATPIELPPTATVVVQGPPGEVQLRPVAFDPLPPARDTRLLRFTLRSISTATLDGETPETLENLPTGDYHVIFTPRDGAPVTRRITLAPGEDRELRLP